MTSISEKEIIELLALRGGEQADLHKRASEIRKNHVSDRIYIRGLIEFSNICVNDCFYCGIRKSNNRINRYELTTQEIMSSVDEAVASGLTSLVLQSGERRDTLFISNVAETLRLIKDKHPDIGITLSCGEQNKNVYREFFEAGASRYLLRIETSDENHYKKLHPESMNFNNRVRCLRDLRSTGYQVGTGVMINSPYQTPEILAGDILFFRELDIDMCGMGPFIPHRDTSMGGWDYNIDESLNLGLNMIAVLRLVMPDINIASTTALETLSHQGREMGIQAGANVVMPQFSPAKNRNQYMLYDNKPVSEKPGSELVDLISRKIKILGLIPAAEESGTSIHYLRRNDNDSSC